MLRAPSQAAEPKKSTDLLVATLQISVGGNSADKLGLFLWSPNGTWGKKRLWKVESYQHGGLVLHSKIITAQEGRMGSEAGSTDKEGLGKKRLRSRWSSINLNFGCTFQKNEDRIIRSGLTQMHHRSAKNEQVIVFKEYCQKSEC